MDLEEHARLVGRLVGNLHKIVKAPGTPIVSGP